jgi:hypothetical protein
LVPVPVRNSIPSYSGLWFLPELVAYWFSLGNIGSCSCQEQYPFLFWPLVSCQRLPLPGSVQQCWFLFLSGTVSFLFRPLIPARNNHFLVPFRQYWFLFLSGTVSFLILALGFMPEIDTSWFRSGNIGSCSWQEQYPSYSSVN